jgi:hypothetical protein
VPALLVVDQLDRDRAVTAVLSGRADLVGLSEAEEDTRGQHDQ